MQNAQQSAHGLSGRACPHRSVARRRQEAQGRSLPRSLLSCRPWRRARPWSCQRARRACGVLSIRATLRDAEVAMGRLVTRTMTRILFANKDVASGSHLLAIGFRLRLSNMPFCCVRFTLSYRDVEDLFGGRGLDVSYETVRRWVLKFGPMFARELRRRRPRPTSRCISISWPQ